MKFKFLILTSLLVVILLQACDVSNVTETTGVIESIDCNPSDSFSLQDGRKFKILAIESHAYCAIPKGTKVKFTYNKRLKITSVDYVTEGEEE